MTKNIHLLIVPVLLSLLYASGAKAFTCRVDMDERSSLDSRVENADFVFTGRLIEIQPREETIIDTSEDFVFTDQPTEMQPREETIPEPRENVPPEIQESASLESYERTYSNGIYKFIILKIHKNFNNEFKNGNNVLISGLDIKYGGETAPKINHTYTITAIKDETEKDADFSNTAQLCDRLVVFSAHEKYDDFSIPEELKK